MTPFSTNHAIEVVNREQMTESLAPSLRLIRKGKTPQFHIGGEWYDFIKRMKVKEMNKLCFLLNHPLNFCYDYGI
jgi:hypothetical protein